MCSEKCPKFNTCEAPLCPLDEESMKYGIWYPDESVCRRKDISNTDWIQKQKKIARISKNKEGYFTVERLIKIERFSSKMKGENPDKENPLEG